MNSETDKRTNDPNWKNYKKATLWSPKVTKQNQKLCVWQGIKRPIFACACVVAFLSCGRCTRCPFKHPSAAPTKNVTCNALTERSFFSLSVKPQISFFPLSFDVGPSSYFVSGMLHHEEPGWWGISLTYHWIHLACCKCHEDASLSRSSGWSWGLWSRSKRPRPHTLQKAQQRAKDRRARLHSVLVFVIKTSLP